MSECEWGDEVGKGDEEKGVSVSRVTREVKEDNYIEGKRKGRERVKVEDKGRIE